MISTTGRSSIDHWLRRMSASSRSNGPSKRGRAMVRCVDFSSAMRTPFLLSVVRSFGGVASGQLRRLYIRHSGAGKGEAGP